MAAVDTGQGRAVDDLPRMVVDQTQVQTWARELTMIVEALGELRDRRERAAEAAAQRHDQQERSARPPVARPLSRDEAAQWHADDGDNGGDGERQTATTFDVGSGRGLRVRYGPVDSGRWVVDAQVDQAGTAAPTGPRGAERPGEPVTLEQVAVSCRSERDARALTDELISAGPEVEKLRLLRRRAAERAARYAAATGRVRETDPNLLDRVREEVRRHWQPELAERVIASPAFPRFAHGLSQLESHGATLDDTLRHQGLQEKLSRPLVRDPAALGASMFQAMLTTIDGEVVTDETRSRSSTEQKQHRRRPLLPGVEDADV
jgi:hypothetical protein